MAALVKLPGVLSSAVVHRYVVYGTGKINVLCLGGGSHSIQLQREGASSMIFGKLCFNKLCLNNLGDH